MVEGRAENCRAYVVADYAQRLNIKCFPCQVFTFGSVPLKAYLPDGDIDLTAFSDNQTFKDTWTHQVRDMLENEEKNEHSEFHVKEVQYIQAEEKMLELREQSLDEGSEPISEAEIYKEVLGKSTGYVKGLGFGPLPQSHSSFKQTTTELQQKVERQNEEIESQQAQLQSQSEEIKQLQ